MIIAAAIEAIRAQLVALGVTPVHLSAAAAASHQGKQWALVLPGPARDSRDGSLVARTVNLETGVATHRRRLYVSTAIVSIALAMPTVAAAELKKAGLLAALGSRVLDASGNAIRISRAAASWEESAASTAARAEVTFGLELEGGIFKDTTRPIAQAIAVVPAGLLE